MFLLSVYQYDIEMQIKILFLFIKSWKEAFWHVLFETMYFQVFGRLNDLIVSIFLYCSIFNICYVLYVLSCFILSYFPIFLFFYFPIFYDLDRPRIYSDEFRGCWHRQWFSWRPQRAEATGQMVVCVSETSPSNRIRSE